MESNNSLVYSTEHGKMCPGCGKPQNRCSCKAPIAETDGIVRVGRQTKGRKGKGVTVITGVPITQDELKKLAATLKNKCGCGGTAKDLVIEIQGDKRDQIIELLQNMGWKVKRSGG